MGKNIKNFGEWQRLNEGWLDDIGAGFKDMAKDISNFFTGKTVGEPAKSVDNLNKEPLKPEIKAEPGLDPKKSDPELSKKYNFHIIPDGKPAGLSNYRSAQLPIEVMEPVFKKYGIKRVIRFNGDGSDGRHHKSDAEVSISEEEKICKAAGVEFFKLSSTSDQEKVNSLLAMGNTLIHCAHGADRTGGNVGGYLHSLDPNGKWTTDKVWSYTTQYNGWNKMSLNSPSSFSNGYLQQAKKFGVKDLDDAQRLARLEKSTY